MKRFFLISSFLCFSGMILAQGLTLDNFNERRIKQQRTAMTILGSWAVGNIAVGLSLQGNATGETKYFHQMNAGWNAVNLVIAGFGYWGTYRTDPSALSLYESFNQHHGFQKVLLFNAGLDIGYMAGGAYLMERSKRQEDDVKRDRLSGFGKSILLQGAFLFVFDLTTYFVLASGNDDLQPLLSAEGIGIRLSF